MKTSKSIPLMDYVIFLCSSVNLVNNSVTKFKPLPIGLILFNDTPLSDFTEGCISLKVVFH